jgi:hypothetical protein
MTGRSIVGGALSLYGSRTNIVWYNSVTKQVDEATLQKIDDKLTWIISGRNLRIANEGRYFAPGNTRSI